MHNKHTHLKTEIVTLDLKKQDPIIVHKKLALNIKAQIN